MEITLSDLQKQVAEKYPDIIEDFHGMDLVYLSGLLDEILSSEYHMRDPSAADSTIADILLSVLSIASQNDVDITEALVRRSIFWDRQYNSKLLETLGDPNSNRSETFTSNLENNTNPNYQIKITEPLRVGDHVISSGTVNYDPLVNADIWYKVYVLNDDKTGWVLDSIYNDYQAAVTRMKHLNHQLGESELIKMHPVKHIKLD